MSMSQAAAEEQIRQNKAMAKGAAKTTGNLVKRFIKELKAGLDPDKALTEVLSKVSAANENKLTRMSEEELIPKDTADKLKKEMQSLNKFKDIDDGNLKAGAHQKINELLEGFKKGDSVETLEKNVKACIDAPDKLRAGINPVKDSTGMMSEVQKYGNDIMTTLNKETLGRAGKQAQKERVKSGRVLDGKTNGLIEKTESFRKNSPDLGKEISETFNKLDAKAKSKKAIQKYGEISKKSSKVLEKGVGKAVIQAAKKGTEAVVKGGAKAAVGATVGVATGGIGFIAEIAITAVKEVAGALGRATGIKEQLNTQKFDRSR